MRAEAFRLPQLKLLTEADEHDRIGDAGMRLQSLRQHHPALAVDLERLARPVERDCELLPLVRIRRKLLDQLVDLGEQRIAARIDRLTVERRIAVEAVESVAREHRTKRRRDGHTPLGIEPHRVIAHEAVHADTHPTLTTKTRPSRSRLRATARPRAAILSDCGRRRPAGRRYPALGKFGISWDYMAVNATLLAGMPP